MKIATSELEHLREEVKNCHCIIKDLQKKREFVGLTWSDVPNEWVGNVAFMEGAKWAETKNKEKNSA